MRRESVVLVVVDIQEKLLPAIHNKENVVENSVKLLRLADVMETPVILTEQYPKGLGRTVDEVAQVFEEIGAPKHRVEKVTFSCAKEPGFSTVLSDYGKEGRRDVVLCGIEAHICVYQTAMDLKEMGYRVILASDATGSRKKSNYKQILRYLTARGVEVVPTETVIFQLLERAGTEEFKRMLPYLK